MRKLVLAVLAPLLIAGTSPADGAPEGHTYEVYLLAGQSNMEGFGYVSELDPAERGEVPRALIYTGRSVADGEEGGGVGLWAPLRAGFGFEFTTDGATNRLSSRFGPELSFARTLTAQDPTARIALVKFSRGGTALVDGVSAYGSWDPDYRSGNGRNQYDMTLTAIDQALSARDIDGDGRTDRLVPRGIVWMQGEADAFDNFAASSNYAANLAGLIARFRAALRNDHLPVVIGRIKDSGDTPETRVMSYSPLVREQQAAFATSDRCAALVTASDGFVLPDGWHYRSADYLVLGRAFADAMRGLQQRCR